MPVRAALLTAALPRIAQAGRRVVAAPVPLKVPRQVVLVDGPHAVELDHVLGGLGKVRVDLGVDRVDRRITDYMRIRKILIRIQLNVTFKKLHELLF